jgi:ligand-binding sensor domain-containing protein
MTWGTVAVLAVWVLAAAGVSAGVAVATLPREPEWRCMAVWHQTQGLPQNTVYKILQTRDGYIWLGTKGGAARFDGVRFVTFGDGPGQLKEGEVWSLAEGPDGSVWFATYGGGVARLKDGHFTYYTTEQGLPTDYVAVLEFDAQGALWIGTDAGVSVLADGTFRHYSTEDGLVRKGVRALLRDSDGSMWIGAIGGGLNRFKDGKLTAVPVAGIGPTSDVRGLHRDRAGHLWIATSEGLIRLEGERATIYGVEQGMSSGRVFAVTEDARGNLWVATEKGLDRLRAGRFQAAAAGSRLSDFHYVYTVHADQEGSVWAGSLRDGLARLKEGLFLSYTTADGLADDNVSTVLADTKRRVWVGTSRGLHRIDGAELRTFAIDKGSNRVSALAEDSTGRLLVGTNEALYRVVFPCPREDCAPRFERLYPPAPATAFLRVILAEADGTVWAGTNLDGVIERRNGTWRTYGVKEGLSNGAVRGMAMSGDGSLWIGTRGGGLNRYKDGVFTVYRKKDGLASDHVQSLHLDRRGALWIATRAGATRFANGRFTRYGVAEGLFTNYVYGFRDDDQGNLWMSSGKGVFRVSLDQLSDLARGTVRSVTSVPYDIEHGLASTVASGSQHPGITRDGDGRVWFATLKGVTVVDPKHLTTNRIPPPVLIEAVEVDGKAQDLKDPVSVPPGRGDFTFRFTGLSFLVPEKVRFLYKLEGYDVDWIEAGARRVAYYTNIPPGAYRFRVTAANNDGVWNKTGAELAFTLAPAFHQSWPFYVLCVVAIAFFGAASQRLRIRYMRARERALRARVDEVVAEMKVLHGLLPICASCKKVRDDGGYWNQIESYIARHSQAEFSHSICPECLAALYPEYAQRRSPDPGSD